MAAVPYATVSDLTTLGVSAAALAGITTPQQQQALQAASDQADGYLRTRYTLPLTAWGQDLRRAVCAIATYDLMVARGYNPADGADENVRLRFKDAIHWLESVAAEKLEPVVTDSSGSPDIGGAFTAQASIQGAGGVSAPGSSPAPSVAQNQGGYVVVGRPSLRGW